MRLSGLDGSLGGWDSHLTNEGIMADTLQDELEGMIDSNDLPTVIDALVEVCHAKAEHLQVNWQDAGSAKYWTRAAKMLDTLSARLK